jgi:hypothetical protein
VHPEAGSQLSRVPAQRTPPDQAAPAPTPPPPAPRRHRLRLALAVIGGTIALLCLAGTAIGYVLYDRATAPDRSAPDVVVDNYLRAFLVDRNDVKAKLYTCAGGGNSAELDALRTDLLAREKRFNTTFNISWGPLHADERGDSAEVTVELIISAMAGNLAQTERQPWQFSTRRDDGWGFCGGHRVR